MFPQHRMEAYNTIKSFWWAHCCQILWQECPLFYYFLAYLDTWARWLSILVFTWSVFIRQIYPGPLDSYLSKYMNLSIFQSAVNNFQISSYCLRLQPWTLQSKIYQNLILRNNVYGKFPGGTTVGLFLLIISFLPWTNPENETAFYEQITYFLFSMFSSGE